MGNQDFDTTVAALQLLMSDMRTEAKVLAIRRAYPDEFMIVANQDKAAHRIEAAAEAIGRIASNMNGSTPFGAAAQEDFRHVLDNVRREILSIKTIIKT